MTDRPVIELIAKFSDYGFLTGRGYIRLSLPDIHTLDWGFMSGRDQRIMNWLHDHQVIQRYVFTDNDHPRGDGHVDDRVRLRPTPLTKPVLYLMDQARNPEEMRRLLSYQADPTHGSF